MEGSNEAIIRRAEELRIRKAAASVGRVRKPIEINLKPGAGKALPVDRHPEREIQKEVQTLPEKEREEIEKGFRNLGFRVDRWKNDFFAKTFKWISKTNLDKNQTTSRFTKELADSFKRDADAAHKKAKEAGDGTKKKNVSNFLTLVGNITKYGRIVADFTGASVANPFRWVMISAVGLARGAQAGKETRLKTEEASAKTRLNATQAAKEAWEIYEKVQKEAGSKNVTGEALKNEYLSRIPEDLKKRLAQPAVASGSIQELVKKQLKNSVDRLNGKIDKIENNNKYTAKEKEAKKKALLKKWENTLNDYDRIITNQGSFDKLAMGAYVLQKASKAVVHAMTIETAVMQLEKWGESAYHIIHNLGAHEAIAPGVGQLISEKFSDVKSGSSTAQVGENFEDVRSGASTNALGRMEDIESGSSTTAPIQAEGPYTENMEDVESGASTTAPGEGPYTKENAEFLKNVGNEDLKKITPHNPFGNYSPTEGPGPYLKENAEFLRNENTDWQHGTPTDPLGHHTDKSILEGPTKARGLANDVTKNSRDFLKNITPSNNPKDWAPKSPFGNYETPVPGLQDSTHGEVLQSGVSQDATYVAPGHTNPNNIKPPFGEFKSGSTLEQHDSAKVIHDLTKGPTISAPQEIPTLDQDAIVRQGEGIENPLIREIIKDPKAFGYKGNEKGLHAFAEGEAHRRYQEYIGKGLKLGDGKEVWVSKPNEVAYQFQKDGEGKIIGILERNAKNGEIIGDSSHVNSYEYEHGSVSHASEIKTAGGSPSVEEVRNKLHDVYDNQDPGYISIDHKEPSLNASLEHANPSQSISGGEKIWDGITEPNPANYKGNASDPRFIADWATYKSLHGSALAGQKMDPQSFLDSHPVKHTGVNRNHFGNVHDDNPDVPRGRARYEPYNGGRPVHGAPDDSYYALSEAANHNADQIYQYNIHQLVPKATEAWGAIGEEPVKRYLGMTESEIDNDSLARLTSYLHKLQVTSGLEPKGKFLFFRGQESTDHYIKRSLRFIARYFPDKLEDVRLK